MPFKSWVRNISPIAWLIGASAVANVVTMSTVMYLAFRDPTIYVSGGHIRATVTGSVDVNDKAPVRVQIAR